jgi:hypothetical protein
MGFFCRGQPDKAGISFKPYVQVLFDFINLAFNYLNNFCSRLTIKQIISMSYHLAQFLFIIQARKGLAMKLHLLDRFLTICLCSALVIGLWSLSMAYPAHSQIAVALA